jgi:hypothetical protein
VGPVQPAPASVFLDTPYEGAQSGTLMRSADKTRFIDPAGFMCVALTVLADRWLMADAGRHRGRRDLCSAFDRTRWYIAGLRPSARTRSEPAACTAPSNRNEQRGLQLLRLYIPKSKRIHTAKLVSRSDTV